MRNDLVESGDFMVVVVKDVFEVVVVIVWSRSIAMVGESHDRLSNL